MLLRRVGSESFLHISQSNIRFAYWEFRTHKLIVAWNAIFQLSLFRKLLYKFYHAFLLEYLVCEPFEYTWDHISIFVLISPPEIFILILRRFFLNLLLLSSRLSFKFTKAHHLACGRSWDKDWLEFLGIFDFDLRIAGIRKKDWLEGILKWRLRVKRVQGLSIGAKTVIKRVKVTHRLPIIIY